MTVLARELGQAQDVARLFGCDYGELTTVARHEWDILINATPVGSAAMPDATPVPAEALRAGALVMDMVYAPRETRLLREARERGCVVVAGAEMLLGQAVVQFETWTGQPAPVAVMREALEGALGAPR